MITTRSGVVKISVDHEFGVGLKFINHAFLLYTCLIMIIFCKNCIKSHPSQVSAAILTSFLELGMEVKFE